MKTLALMLCGMVAQASPPAMALMVGDKAAKVLTLEAALETFRAQGFDLLLAQTEAQGALGDARAAGALTNPVVAATVSHAGRPYRAALCPGGGCSTTGYAVTVADEAGITDSAFGKRHLRAQLGALAAESAAYGVLDVRRQLEGALKAQFLAVALDQAEFTFSEATRKTYQKTLALFADRYQSGDISEADVTRVEVEALQAQQREDGAKAALEDDKAALALLLGYRGEVPVFEVEAAWVGAGPDARWVGLSEERLLALAQSHRSDVMMLERDRASAQAAAALAHRLLWPEVTLSFNYQQFGTGQNAIQPRTYTGGMALALPVLYRQQGELMRAEANVRAATLKLERAQAQVIADVHRAHQALTYAHKRYLRSSAQLLARSERALELVRLQFAKGAASLLDLLDAQRTLNQVTLTHLALQGEVWVAVFGLEQALGTEVRP